MSDLKERPYPFDEFPDKGSTWESCLRKYDELEAKLKESDRKVAELDRYRDVAFYIAMIHCKGTGALASDYLREMFHCMDEWKEQSDE